jgi:hypothetical protein
MAYWKLVEPMSWSDDDRYVYFLYDNRSMDVVYRVASDGLNKVDRIYESPTKIFAIQAVGDDVYVSAGNAMRVSISDGKATPVVVPGFTLKAAFVSANGDLAFVAADQETHKDALWVQESNGTITKVDAGPVATTPGYSMSASGDRKRLAYSSSKGASIVELAKPYPVHVLKSGGIRGWLTNDRVVTEANQDCSQPCDWELSNGFIPSELKSSYRWLQTSSSGTKIARDVSVASPPGYRVGGIAISKPDGSDYHLVLDGNVLPQGPLSRDLVGWR